MNILNITAYKFIFLSDLSCLRADFLEKCTKLKLKGTILLSKEGININLAAPPENIREFIIFLKDDMRFADIIFHELFSDILPFKRLIIKIKNEIITFRQSEISPIKKRAPRLSPTTFKTWLDEKRDMTILDTRNDYEIRFGTFEKALHLDIKDFNHLPDSLEKLPNNKLIVMFCTGGIRCEKAALYLLQHGYSNVFQLDGGILGYFSQAGGAHYVGDCFVFDDRIAVNKELKPTETMQCKVCQSPVTKVQQELSTFVVGHSCPTCISEN